MYPLACQHEGQHCTKPAHLEATMFRASRKPNNDKVGFIFAPKLKTEHGVVRIWQIVVFVLVSSQLFAVGWFHFRPCTFHFHQAGCFCPSLKLWKIAAQPPEKMQSCACDAR